MHCQSQTTRTQHSDTISEKMKSEKEITEIRDSIKKEMDELKAEIDAFKNRPTSTEFAIGEIEKGFEKFSEGTFKYVKIVNHLNAQLEIIERILN